MIEVKHEWATPLNVHRILRDLALVKRHDNYWLRNNCCYVNLHIDGKGMVKDVSNQHRDVCHARLRTGAEHNFCALYFNYRPVEERKKVMYSMPIEDVLLYIDWMVNESPFAGIFLSKNPSDILEYGALIDTRTHYGLAFAAAIATRFYHEHGQHFVTWLHLVKAGVDKNVAYVIALAYRSYPMEGDIPEFALPIESLQINPSHINHGGVDSYGWSEADVKRWMLATPLKETENRKSADASFTDGNGKRQWFATTLFKDLPVKEKKAGRFGQALVYTSLEDFIQFVKEKAEPVLLGFAKDKQKVVLVQPKHNGDEPEVDL